MWWVMIVILGKLLIIYSIGTSGIGGASQLENATALTFAIARFVAYLWVVATVRSKKWEMMIKELCFMNKLMMNQEVEGDKVKKQNKRSSALRAKILKFQNQLIVLEILSRIVVNFLYAIRQFNVNPEGERWFWLFHDILGNTFIYGGGK